MTQVTIIIPTLFPSPTLREYVERLAKYKSVKEVIIAINSDNMTTSSNQDRSNDQSSVVDGLKRITHEVSSIKMVILGKNKGFTGACNAGTKMATGDYLLFLNDDCQMDDENFVKMVEFLEKNQDLVATQPVVYKQSKEQSPESKVIENIGFTVDTRIGKASAITESSLLSGESGQGPVVSRQIKNSADTRRLTTDAYLYGLSGTCLLIRKDIFEKIGMWDESFHSYLEDVDLALRMRKFGHKFAPCLDSEVIHAHMATSRRMGMYKPMQDMKNWWRLIMKHSDIFVHVSNLIPLFLERGRNVSGVVKKYLVTSTKC